MSDERPQPPSAQGTHRNIQDFVGGAVLVAIALFAFWAADDLAGMKGPLFGPGTAPRLLAALLGATGAVIAVGGLLEKGPGVPVYAVRGPLLVTASVLLFAGTIQSLGLVLSSFLTFTFAASGSRETKWSEAILAALVMTLFCTLLFAYFLQLPFQLWPRFTIAGVRFAF